MTVTVITPSPLQILVISCCDLYYPLKKLIAHNLITLILDLGASIPLRGWERASGLGVDMPTLLPIASQDKTNKRLVLAEAFSLSWQPKMQIMSQLLYKRNLTM